jgi:hypothetical protein
VTAMKREKWQPTATSFLCSVHFQDCCFRQYNSQVRLKEDAVPSIFNFPQHLQKVVKQRRPLKRLHTVSDVLCPSSQVGASVSKSAPMDLCLEDSVGVMHNYAASPRKLKRKYEALLQQQKDQTEAVRKRLKVCQQRLYRNKVKMNSMKDIIKELKSRNDVNIDVDLIERLFGHIPVEMLKRKLALKSKQPYSDDLRSFALTLHFYSPKAYDFVRSTFLLALPHPSTLRQWCSAVEGKPGFTRESFEVRACFIIV